MLLHNIVLYLHTYTYIAEEQLAVLIFISKLYNKLEIAQHTTIVLLFYCNIKNMKALY